MQNNNNETTATKRTRNSRLTYAAIIANSGNSKPEFKLLPEGAGIQLTAPNPQKATPDNWSSWANAMTYLQANGLQCLDGSGIYRHFGGKSDPKKQGKTQASEEELIQRLTQDVEALQALQTVKGYGALLRHKKFSLNAICATIRTLNSQGKQLTIPNLNTELSRVKRKVASEVSESVIKTA